MRNDRFETRKPHRQPEPAFGNQPQRDLCLPNQYPADNLVSPR